jgi:TolB-like protein/DNA-binding winged helix-turn-helix (wHTH) protein/Tfp pilus assembly protein PilF
MEKIPHNKQFFDGFTLDLTRGCLLRGNQEIPLEPKPFDALTYLVQNPGRLIRKAELMQALWPDTAVTEDSLVQCLIKVRNALGDHSHIIKTIPRRGYIFDTEVRDTSAAQMMTYTEETSGVHLIIEEGESDGQRTAATLPATANAVLLPEHSATSMQRLTTAFKHHPRVSAGALATLTLMATAFLYFTRPREAIDSIAVMPFVNVNGDPNVDYLSEGIGDNVIERLSRLPNLKKVIALNSVLRYKGKQTDPQEIGRELGVRAVLLGRIIQHGDDLSITTELVDVGDNSHLWSGQYNVKLADIMSLQVQIAQEISEKLRLRLSGEEKQQLTKRYTQSGEAYQLYMMGCYYRRRGTKEAFNKSMDYLEQATKKDPGYAPAYAELGEVYRNIAWRGFSLPKEVREKEELAALKALQIDDALAQAHIVMANIKEINFDWVGAEEEYKRALELDPNSVRAHQTYARHLEMFSRFDEALLSVRRAQELDPLDLEVNVELANVFTNSRQYDQAIQQHLKIVEMDPNFPDHGRLAELYQLKGMYQEATAELKKPNTPKAQLAYGYAVAGEKDEALKILDEMKQDQSQGRYVAPFAFALVYMGLGDKDQAFEWLNKTFDENPYRLSFLKVNPRFDGLRSDPRFTDLLRRMKLAA